MSGVFWFLFLYVRTTEIFNIVLTIMRKFNHTIKLWETVTQHRLGVEDEII